MKSEGKYTPWGVRFSHILVSELQVLSWFAFKTMTLPRVELEKFDGHGDYMLWKDKLLAQMDLQGLSKALEESDKVREKVRDPDETPEEKKTAEEKEETLAEKIKKARSTIVLSVTNRVLRKIRKEETAAGMLKALDMLYLAKALLNRFYLKQKLYGFKMSESLSIESNIDEFLHLITDLENIDVQVADEDQAILLLMSLPRQFDQLRDTLRYGTGRTTLTLDEVVAAIYAKELENGSNSKGSKGEAESLYVREKGDQRGRSDNRDINSRSKSRSKSRGRKVCWSCGEEGHFKGSCPNKGKTHNKPKHQGSSSRGEAAMVKDNKNEATGLYVLEALYSTDINLENEWVLDTGCSYHMTYKKGWFETLKDVSGGSVRMGNKTTSKVRGVGTVRIKNEDGFMFLLTGVRYIPEMDRNLLSVGTMEELGYSFASKEGIHKDNKIVLKG